MAFTLNRPVLVRIAPFAVFMLFLAARGAWPENAYGGWDSRWVYAISVVVVGALLIAFRRDYGELDRQNLPDAREALLAIGVGIAVCVLWVVLDAPWMRIGDPSAAFVPLDANGKLEWPLVVARFVGAALLVPVMEELFWRSFLMRWIEHPRFESVVPRRVGLKAVALSTFVFMLAHTLWLAAIVAGLAYAWLYIRTGKLWTAVIAHAVTNGALGGWVVATGRWEYW